MWKRTGISSLPCKTKFNFNMIFKSEYVKCFVLKYGSVFIFFKVHIKTSTLIYINLDTGILKASCYYLVLLNKWWGELSSYEMWKNFQLITNESALKLTLWNRTEWSMCTFNLLDFRKTNALQYDQTQ